MIHAKPHPLSGFAVLVEVTGPYTGAPREKSLYSFTVEDWADRVWGKSWGVMSGNPTAIIYALRTSLLDVEHSSLDDEVLYGKIDGMAVLIHQSEIPGLKDDE